MKEGRGYRGKMSIVLFGVSIEPVPILLISSFNGQTGNHLAMSIRPSASKLSSLFAF